MARLNSCLLLLIAGVLLVVATADRAYVTYHMYTPDFPLTSCACSDGQNGLITRYQQTTVQRWYPHVSAASFATWNSPECGGCYSLTADNGNSILVTVIDQCGQQPGYSAHFDVSPDAFATLDGSLTAGHIDVSYSKVKSTPCDT